MSVSEPPETTLQLNDLSCTKVKETALKTDGPVGANACNNNHEVENRLKLLGDTSNSGIVNDESNPGMANGSVERSVCCQPANGFTLNNSDNDNENQDQSQNPLKHSFVTKCDSEKVVIETATCPVTDSGLNVSQISPPNESAVLIESEDADQSGKSVFSSIDVCDSGEVEKLINDLEHTSLQDKPTAEQGDNEDGITYVVYESEKQMPDIMRLITKDLSEPYSIYTYRYFIHNWPKLCFLAMDRDTCIGAIVCKLDLHKKMVRRGYIAMLAVDSAYRRRKLGSTLVTKAIKAMIRDDCDEVVLETEITNQAALRLYENLGFVRDKRLFRYYLNGVDALRLKLWLR